MKGKSVGKLLILSSLSVVALFACNKDKNTVAETAPSQSKMLSVYVYSGNKKDAPEYLGLMDVKFYNINGLPYVNVIDYINAFTGYSTDVYSVTHKNDVFTFTNNIWKYRSSSYKPKAYFNMKTQTLKYDDYACFVNINSGAYHPMDLVAAGDVVVEEPEGVYHNICRNPTGNYIAGNAVEINVRDTYNIESYVYQNNLYMPLYTAKTLFTSNYIPSFFYDGINIYQQVPNTTDYESYLKSLKPKTLYNIIDSKYMNYNYNQMALELDLRFGMGGLTRKNRKDDVDYTFKTGLNNSCYQWLNKYKTGLTDKSSYEDTVEEIYASEYLDDGGHTGIYSKIYNEKPTDPDNPPFDRGAENGYISESYNNILNNRYRKDKSQRDFIGHINNSSSLVLRSHSFDKELFFDLYNLCINQSSEPYKNYTNYIIDLSCNGGGYIYMQHILNQYLSQGKTYNYFYCSVNGSRGSIKYDIDLNLNGIFGDSNDYVVDNAKIEIICSHATFSAANATACYANNVTIKGERTGGGTCAVDSTVMSALGAGFQISSPYRITNSSYKDNDYGVAPVAESGFEWDSHTPADYSKFSYYDNTDLVLFE